MQDLLQDFPRPVLVVDGALQIVAYSQKVFSVFGLRSRGSFAESGERLAQVIEDERELGDELALATVRLFRPGDEEIFSWAHRKRNYEITVHARANEELLVIFEDMTDFAISEEILMNARRYLEHILGNIPLGVIVLNSELRITSMNRQEQKFIKSMGVEFNFVDTIGATLEELMPEGIGAQWHALCARTLESDERQEEPRQAYDGPDGPLVLAIMATPLPDPQGRAAGVMFIAEDVTEEARLENELVRAEKLATVGQMVITVNHEINNPLSIISTNAQTLRILNKSLSEKSVDKLLKIEEQVKRIADVTERLRKMDEVVTDAYVRGGDQMIDVWKEDTQEQGEDE
ncbi:MAG: PAS domain-containing protein [Candidatus Latescibacterota bacterium]|jgi:PAS domain S-box-containing protein